MDLFTQTPFMLTEGVKTSKSDSNDTITTTTAAHTINTYDAPGTNNYWDVILTDEQASSLDLTPELSPSMSLCSPAIDLINSPFSYDSLGLNDFDPSPVDTLYESFESPYDELLSLETIPASYQYTDFGFTRQDASEMIDFQLFPDCATPESAKLRMILLESPSFEVAAEDPAACSDSELSVETIRPADMTISQELESAMGPQFPSFVSTLLKENLSNPLFNEPSPFLDTISTPDTPLIDDFDCVDVPDATSAFSMAKTLGQDVIAPDTRVAPRKPVQSPTKPGFQPNKRPRRRRITSEEASRVVPDDDPSGVARYKCSECSKTFSRPFNLKSHRAIHRGLKPHACTYTNESGVTCHWSFARRHDLERHVRSRHDNNTHA